MKNKCRKATRMFAREKVDNTKGLEKSVSPVCRIKIKVCATFAKVMNSEYYTELLNAMEFELKNIIRASDVAVL